MPNPYRNNTRTEKYDPRWLIWTIVFLVVVGASLSAYITWSDHGTYDSPELPKRLSRNQ